MSQDHHHKFDPKKFAKLEDPRRKEYFPQEPVAEALALQPGQQVLDIGCGVGYFLLALLDLAPEGVRFTGADIEPAMLERLGDKLNGHPRRELVTLVQSAEHTLPVEEESQNAAILSLVYHELADRKGFLKEILRVLAPGGHLAMVDWDVLPAGVERTMGPPVDHRVSMETARNEALQAGFEQAKKLDGYRESYAMILTKPKA